jgi:hypothetical protein
VAILAHRFRHKQFQDQPTTKDCILERGTCMVPGSRMPYLAFSPNVEIFKLRHYLAVVWFDLCCGGLLACLGVCGRRSAAR